MALLKLVNAVDTVVTELSQGEAGDGTSGIGAPLLGILQTQLSFT